MTTTTLKLRSVAEHANGVSLVQVAPLATWKYSQWKVIAPRTNSLMYIQAISFQVTRVTTADTTYEVLLEIGFGKVGNPTLKAQVPYSFRSDTAVGIYLGKTVFFPEPFEVPAGVDVCVRYANSTASADTINGIKLIVQNDTRPVMPNETVNFNNYLHVSAPEGSVTEKTR